MDAAALAFFVAFIGIPLAGLIVAVWLHRPGLTWRFEHRFLGRHFVLLKYGYEFEIARVTVPPSGCIYCSYLGSHYPLFGDGTAGAERRLWQPLTFQPVANDPVGRFLPVRHPAR